MGEAPPWYVALRAADRLHMALPELLKHPERTTLIRIGLDALDAEGHAAEAKAKRRRW